jgi:hypothetical protein
VSAVAIERALIRQELTLASARMAGSSPAMTHGATNT